MPPAFLQPLLDWYAVHRREMPWRGHPDPYAVWVSEIMLQQTKVDTVRGYFERFLAAFPTPAALAAASEQAVLKQWEGLGYYTRARNLHRAARRLAAVGGRLPDDAAGWAALPGVGPYTAAAIASICHGQPLPVVDGNVIRVFARYLGWDDDFRRPAARARLAGHLTPAIAAAPVPGDFNQAIMELGALVCTPRAPRCPECPLRPACVALHGNRQTALPVRPPRKPLPVRRLVAVILRDASGRLLLTRRDSENLLRGLWELPSVVPLRATPTRADAARALALHNVTAAACRRLGQITHTFSHFNLVMTVYLATGPVGLPSAAQFLDPAPLPLTTAARRALRLS